MHLGQPLQGSSARLGSLLLTAALLGACGGGPRLQVSVLDSSGPAPVPLAAARVSLQASGAAAAGPEKTTTASGKAEFERLPSGLYQVRIAKPGYSAAQAEVSFPAKRQVQLSVHQVYSVRGSVLFPDGRPVEDAVVYFIATGGRGRRSAEMSGSEYTIDELAPAVYQIQAGTRDRLYSITLDDFVLQESVTRDITLDEMPPQFDMLEDEPLAVPSSSGRGRIPKQ